jgi:predicted permease
MPDSPSALERELRRRLSVFKLAPADEAAIATELSQHVQDRLAELRRAGMSDADARRITLEELSEEELRAGGWRKLPRPAAPDPPPGTRSARYIDALLRDARYAVRALSRQRGYALAATLALALGIGATSAIFAAVDAVLLRPMPFPHADRLFVPVSQNASRGSMRVNVTFADYEEWRRERDLFAEVALWRPGFADLTGEGDPERVRLTTVSEQFFSLVDVTPLLGRTLVPADHAAGAALVMVITERLWRQRFGGAPDIIGRRVRLAGVPREIVGVLPVRRVWPDGGVLFLPMQTAAFSEDVRTRRDNFVFGGLARLQEDVSVDAAQARLTSMAARVERDHPASRKGWTITLIPLRDYIVSQDLARALYVLLAAVAAVLLIACVNVANLALVRGSGRARELAVRLSLGASRRHLIQQLLVEGLVLAIAGAITGIGLAVIIVQGLVAIAPPGTPFVEDIAMNPRVLASTLVAGLIAAVISGLIPALSASGQTLTTALREGSAGAGSTHRANRLRDALVVIEIAAAVVLVTGSALLIRSFDRLSRVDPGVTLDRVVSGRLTLPGSRYRTLATRAQFTEDLARRLEESADVESAAITSYLPAGGGGSQLGRVFVAEGRPEPPVSPDVGAEWAVVTPRYFRTSGIPVLEGRSFSADDRADTTPVIIVSRSFARRMFPNESAIGRRVRSWRDENVLREIVGVVADVRFSGLADRERALIYIPYAQDDGSVGGMVAVARSRSADAAALGATLRRAVGAIDRDLAVADVRTLAESARQSIASQRYATLLLSVLAAVALTLSALGIYGVTSYMFALRRHEMGIRLALGATRGNLYALVFRHGFVLTLVGLALGLGVAAGVTRWMETLLFQTSSRDTASWVAMVVVIVLSTVLACLIPARRTATADPTIALRAE